jgi:hypothetical protein
MRGSPEGPVDDTFGISSKRKEHFSPSGWEANSPKRPRLEDEQNALSLKPNQLGGSWLDASGAGAGFSSFDVEVQSSRAVQCQGFQCGHGYSLKQARQQVSIRHSGQMGRGCLPYHPSLLKISWDNHGSTAFCLGRKQMVFMPSLPTWRHPLGSLGLLAGSEEQNLDGTFWQNSMMLRNDIPANGNSKNWIDPHTDWGLSGSIATAMDWGPAISSFPDNRSVSDTHLTYQTSLETQNTTCKTIVQTAVQEMFMLGMRSQPDTHMDQNLHLLDYSMDEDEIHDAITDGSTDGTEETRVCFGMVCSNLSYYLHNAQKLTF